MPREAPLSVYLFGAGKVGRALSRALRGGPCEVTLRPARRGFPARLPRADLVVLAVRDTELGALDRQLASRASVPAAAVHCAGALGPDALRALRARGTSVAQLHPLISLAGAGSALAGAFAHVSGDRRAVALARRVSRAAGMQPFTVEGLDLTLYHASAALLANGGAALAAAAAVGMERAGVPAAQAPALLGPLLVSVGRNVGALGLPAALTGPVRRGDTAAVAAHLAVLQARAPELSALYVALARAQLPLARALGDADPDAIARLEALLSSRG